MKLNSLRLNHTPVVFFESVIVNLNFDFPCLKRNQQFALPKTRKTLYRVSVKSRHIGQLDIFQYKIQNYDYIFFASTD